MDLRPDGERRFNADEIGRVLARVRETSDGQYADVYGHRIRIHRLSLSPNGQRRYDEDEIHRVLARMSRN